MVDEDKELPALQHEPEVSNRGVDGQQLPFKGAVVGLGRRQLLGE